MAPRYLNEFHRHNSQAFREDLQSLWRMHRPSFPFCLFIAIILLASCANRKTAATLNDVETYIQARPDSALATIRAIDTTTLTTRSLRAHYALLHAMALDKNWIDTTDVNVVMPAVEYYDRHPSGIRRAKAWYYLGRNQQNGENRPDASISFLKAERYAESSDDSDFKGLICLSMASIYSQTHLHEDALKYSERAYSYFVKAGDSINTSSALLCIAKAYNNLERYTESDSLYQELIKDNHIHPNHRAGLLCSYALFCVTNNEDYDKAIGLFEEVLSLTGSLPLVNYWCAYAYALSRTGRTMRANQIFKQLERINNPFQQYILDTWKSMADALDGDYYSAYHLQKAASDIQDENVREILRQSAIKAQKDYLEQVNLETEKSAKRRLAIVWLIVVLFLTVTLLFLFLFKRRRERNAQDKEELIDAYKSLTMEHSALITRYSNLSAQVDRIEMEKASVRNKYIQICQSQFGNIGRINEILLYHSNEADNNLYKELKRALQKIGVDAQNQQAFEKELNEIFDNVMIHFREAFPGKKPRYYQLVSLLFAGFDAATICAIMPDYKKYNIYVEKHRLKQLILESDSPYKEQFGLLVV